MKIMNTTVAVSALAMIGILTGCASSLPSAGSAATGVAGSSLATGAAASTAAGAATSNGLTDLLVSQLGVTNQQALGGAGSIFELAKSHLSPTDFTKLSSVVPGMSGMLAAAPALSAMTGGGGGMLGAAASMMGGQAGGLGSLAMLGSAFQGLGMNSSMVSQFLPVVMQYVQSQGGPAMMGLLKGALI